jgi:Ni/Fe-hydrogenase subunit HybB-like protein
MHQSSLGSLLVVFGTQVNPIYQTTLLPLLFLVSCIGMGLAAVVFEGTVSSMAFNRPFERELLGKLMGIGVLLAGTFVIARFLDLAVRGALPLIFEPKVVVLFFWLETLLFTAPIALLWSKEARRNAQRLFVGATLLAVGGIIYRISAYLIAYETGPGWSYFPSMGELSVTIGLIAFEILAITIAIRMLPILPKR